MDYTETFTEIFSGRGFSNYLEFEKVINDFQELTGLRFIFKRTFLFPTEHPRRATLVYKSLQYVCSESKPRTGTGCEASFTVGCRNGFLYVSKFHMVHNHAIIKRTLEKPKPEPYIVITDYSTQFMEIFPSLVFSSLSELEDKMEEFQIKTGCMYAKRHTCPWPKDDLEHQSVVYRKFAYECLHFGYCKDRSISKPDRRSSRTGCKSVIFVTCRNNQLHISRFDVRHNHPVSGSCGYVYRRNRRLNPQQLAIIKDMLREHQHEFALKEYIQSAFHVYLTTTDVRNLKRKLQPKKNARRLLGLTLKSLGSAGYAEILSDEDGIDRVLSFTAPYLVKNFHFYPEVVLIRELSGAAFSVYHFSIVDRQLTSKTVMFSFVLDQGVCGTFASVLQSFKHLMQSRVEEVETIFVDINSIERHEILQELPQARMLFYQDSVLSYVRDQMDDLSTIHCDKKGLFQHFFNALKTPDSETYLESLQEIANASPSFWNIINKIWIPCVEQWAEHHRLDQLTFGVENRNSSSLEHFESVLKTDNSLDSCAKRLLELATPSKHSYEVICKDDFPGQPDDVNAILRLLSEPVAGVVLAHLETAKISSDILPDLAARKCCCPFNLQWRLPCLHLIKTARSAYIPLPSLLKGSRWLEHWPMECSEVDGVVETVVEEDTELALLSPTARLLKIDMQVHDNQEMVLSSDSAKCRRRQLQLKNLERRWLHEDVALPSTSADAPS
ncbi:unnamed protein product [Hydatigera taeniaeformis]|uniref:SWIM-type domain-containing protein n=1 Tax=Hydatigena taeniaeformis TaxID=6205 RepID=A0A0R3X5C6_HYDTA|nr:unnamed protein product [Hydatigera taeniaeformis]